MKYILILFLFSSFSAFADNSYTRLMQWEAEERFESPQNFSSGRDAYYFQRQYHRREAEIRREDRRKDSLDAHTQEFLNL